MAKFSGMKLKELRSKAGETLDDVSKAVGVTKAAISAYEHGNRTPSDDVKIKLANHFGRSVGFIFFTDHTHSE